jgi:hypothetical protein
VRAGQTWHRWFMDHHKAIDHAAPARLDRIPAQGTTPGARRRRRMPQLTTASTPLDKHLVMGDAAPKVSVVLVHQGPLTPGVALHRWAHFDNPFLL